MRRFLLCALLLLLFLLAAREVGSTPSRTGARAGEDREERARDHEAFFGHPGMAIPPDLSPTGHLRRGNRPRRVDGEIQFRLRDRGYRAVGIRGSFTDWEILPLRRRSSEPVWEIVLPLPRGRHRYQYIVVDEEGRERKRTDPSNPRRKRDAEHRWVSEIIIDRNGKVRERPLAKRRDEDYDLDLLENLGLSYQRVDGLSLFTRPRFRSRQAYAPALYGLLGYGFKSDRWSARLSFVQPLLSDGSLRLLLSAYDQTDFTDRTGVGDFENSVSSLAFREDNRDYHRIEGIRLGLEAELGRSLLGKVQLRADDYRSLARQARAGWWGREDFLPNPPVDEGVLRSLLVEMRLGSALDHLSVSWELSDDSLAPTSVEFQQLNAQLRRRMWLGREQYLDLRLAFGTSLGGRLPVQRQYVLGGIGTVRGYRYQSLLEPAPDAPSAASRPFGGQRMALANAEYGFGLDESLRFALFYDAGMAYVDRDADLDVDGWRDSIGIGILLEEDGGLRFDFAKPLDGGGDILLQARLERMF